MKSHDVFKAGVVKCDSSGIFQSHDECLIVLLAVVCFGRSGKIDVSYIYIKMETSFVLVGTPTFQ